jgi:hypothetical protein
VHSRRESTGDEGESQPGLSRYDAEKATSGYHDAALDALRVSLWNPIISKFSWRKHRDLRRIDEELERDRRGLSAAAQETREKKEALNKMFDELAAVSAGRADT